MDQVLLLIPITALLFFLVTSLILLHNRRYFQGLKDFDSDSGRQFDFEKSVDSGNSGRDPSPFVSVLIPARNEERNIGRLLASLDSQTLSDMEIIVLDDHSTDKTGDIVRQQAAMSVHSIRIINGTQCPDDWLGKNWACHQLSKAARGELFIFLDADTWLSATAVSNIVSSMLNERLDFATVWPHQKMISVLEKSVIATVYAAVILYLPVNYCFQAPRWIPFENLRKRTKPVFASACGQCMVFTRKSYDAIGGHLSVKKEIVEDVMLAKLIVRSGLVMKMFHGTDRLWCRMYNSADEIFLGFRKNFLAGFGNHLLPFIAAGFLHVIVYLLPPILVLAILSGLITVSNPVAVTGTAAFATAIPVLQRLWVSTFLNWPRTTALLVIPGVLWFQFLALVVVADKLFNFKVTWKDRSI